MKHVSRITPLALILLAAVVAGCSSTPELGSRWTDNGTTGLQGNTFLVKSQNILIGLHNDNEYLYLTVTAGDRMKQRQIAVQGLTVWFDAKGGDDKRFGIHYPLGVMRPQIEGRGQDFMRDTSWDTAESLSDELDILGPADGEHHRMHMLEAKGVDVKMENREGTLIYSLKVPLMDNGGHAFAIGAKPGSVIGLGIETPEMSGVRNRGEGQESGGGGGRGRRGFGGRGDRGFGGGGGRGDQGSPDGARGAREPIKFWGKVTLAAH